MSHQEQSKEKITQETPPNQLLTNAEQAQQRLLHNNHFINPTANPIAQHPTAPPVYQDQKQQPLAQNVFKGLNQFEQPTAQQKDQFHQEPPQYQQQQPMRFMHKQQEAPNSTVPDASLSANNQ